MAGEAGKSANESATGSVGVGGGPWLCLWAALHCGEAGGGVVAWPCGLMAFGAVCRLLWWSGRSWWWSGRSGDRCHTPPTPWPVALSCGVAGPVAAFAVLGAGSGWGGAQACTVSSFTAVVAGGVLRPLFALQLQVHAAGDAVCRVDVVVQAELL